MADAVQQDKSNTGTDALASALKSAHDAQLVTPEENEAKVKSFLKDAKKLLEELRHDNKVDDAADALIAEVDNEELLIPAEQQFGMGPRANNDAVTPDEQRQIDLATEQFKQSVKRVDNQVLARYIQAIQNGSYSEAENILATARSSAQVSTLKFALLTIGAILLPLYAKQRLSKLFTQFGLQAVFANTKNNQDDMRLQAERGAKSHVQTIAKDIKKGLDNAIESEFTSPDIEAAIKDEYPDLGNFDENRFLAEIKKDEHIYKFARERVMEGNSRNQVMAKLQAEFSEVGTRRANVIAANEANRVFTMSQFDADQQFLAQNKLTPKAYKRLVSNTGNPEAICEAIIEETRIKPIPFHDDFIPFGQEYRVESGDKTYKITPKYEKIKSGHIHVGCHCRYELLLKQDDGTFFNTYDGKVLNGFQETEHPRWPKGTPKGGKFIKIGDVQVSDKDIATGIKLKNDIQDAEDAVWGADAGDPDIDPEQARFGREAAYSAMSKHYRNVLAQNGFDANAYAKLKHDQYEYSMGVGQRGEDGNYIDPPAIQKQTGAQMVHTALTQAILRKSYTNINLYRGQDPRFANDPKGIVSFTDSKAIGYSFGTDVKSDMVSVTDVLFHYQLDFSSAHPTEQEIIVKR